jgi:hypothetical protein
VRTSRPIGASTRSGEEPGPGQNGDRCAATEIEWPTALGFDGKPIPGKAKTPEKSRVLALRDGSKRTPVDVFVEGLAG